MSTRENIRLIARSSLPPQHHPNKKMQIQNSINTWNLKQNPGISVNLGHNTHETKKKEKGDKKYNNNKNNRGLLED